MIAIVERLGEGASKMSAIFSSCRTWRYRLDRDFVRNGPTIAFGLHNPSTAAEECDDPTSRRGIGYVRAWGGGKLVFVNPWAGCATRPEDLWRMQDPVGPDNDFYVDAVAREVVETGGFFVFAWGAVAPPRPLKGTVNKRLREFEKLVRDRGCDVRALGVTKSGHPRHPLYMRADAVLVPWAVKKQE